MARTATATGKSETDGNLTGNQRRNFEAVALNIEAVTSGFHIPPLKYKTFKGIKARELSFQKPYCLFFKTRRKDRFSFPILYTPLSILDVKS